MFSRYDRKPTLLLDLACGTGAFSEELLKQGIDVIGVDASEEMLNIARERLPECLLLNQKAEELDLYGTVDGAVCLMDSLNHITDYDDFCKAIERTALFLEKDRLFVFDVNTEYKHKNILGNNSFVMEGDGVFCTWQNETDQNVVTEIMLDFFIEQESGEYLRFSEDFCERAYTKPQIENALNSAGLEIVAILDDMTFLEPKKTSERLYYVTRKI
jgi:ubiquinone/menaquinone biosynthesis C-methylase UbiE